MTLNYSTFSRVIQCSQPADPSSAMDVNNWTMAGNHQNQIRSYGGNNQEPWFRQLEISKLNVVVLYCSSQFKWGGGVRMQLEDESNLMNAAQCSVLPNLFQKLALSLNAVCMHKNHHEWVYLALLSNAKFLGDVLLLKTKAHLALDMIECKSRSSRSNRLITSLPTAL